MRWLHSPSDACLARQQCAPGKAGRTVSVNPYHELIAARRAAQQTVAFKEQMHRRAAIEGTISELVRGHGARRARYRRHPKVRLQMFFLGAAVNIKRLVRALAQQKTTASQALAYA